MNPDRYLYKHPDRPSSFATALYTLLGVEDFQDFKKAFVLTDAMRCHVLSDHIPEKALSYCARHLREELKQFPNLQTLVILGEDAYLQLQRDILERHADEIKPFEEMLKAEGWAQEDVSFPHVKTGTLHVIYGYHPAIGYKHSPPLTPALPPLSP